MRSIAFAGPFLFMALPAVAEITLTAPDSVPAGGQVIVEYAGDSDERDFITIVPSDRAEGGYDDYQYARGGGQVELRAPEVAGDYEIRYLDAAAPYPTHARQALTVTPVSATLEVPEQVDAGARFPVGWTGPDNAQDFIALGNPGEEQQWHSYVYTRKGSPLEMTAPDEPGGYEVRYQTGRGHLVLAAVPLTVGGTGATLTAPESVTAGQHFEVAWTGPDNAQDFIALGNPGEEQQWHSYVYTRKGSPVTLPAPDAPGEYQVRYQTGQSYRVLAHRTVTVTAAGASLEAPAEVQGGTAVEVGWSGPDNPGDYIGLARSEADERSAATWTYTRYGSPLSVPAPLDPGAYELRYQTGQTGRILARRPVTITPPPQEPGHLRVALDDAAGGFAGGDAVELILDASGSMLQQQDGKRRIEIAREVLLGLTGEVIPAGTPFALRVFGHKEADACRTDLEVPLAPLDVAAVDATLAGIQAKNLAKTPIARSLELVAEDLGAATGERLVVLITDGEETCEGDPAAAVEALRAAGIDVRVDIVGFAIDDAELKAQFRYWADLGGGAYHDAAGAGDLAESMARALRPPYEVLNAAGERVAEGTAGDAGVTLPPGDYTVRTRSASPREARATVTAGEQTGVTLR